MNKHRYLLAAMAVMLSGCDSMADIIDDTPCIWACTDLTRIQTAYVENRDECQVSAEQQMPLYVNLNDNVTGDDARNAQLLGLFSSCMQRKDWGVTGPKPEVPPGTPVASNPPTWPGAINPGAPPAAYAPGMVRPPASPTAAPAAQPTPYTPTVVGAVGAGAPAAAYAPGLAQQSSSIIIPPPKPKPIYVPPAPAIQSTPQLAPPAAPREQRKPVNSPQGSSTGQDYVYPPTAPYSASTSVAVPPPPASAYAPSNVPSPIVPQNYAPAAPERIVVPEYPIPKKY